MSSDTPTPEQTVEDTPPTTEPTEVAPAMQELLNQLKEQTTANASLRMQQDDASKQMEALSAKINDYQSVGKKRRQDAIDGAVKDWVSQMVKTHAKELGPHEAKLTELIDSMKNHDEADSMVQMLSCAANASATSTTKLNNAYQALKKEQESNKKLKRAIEDASKPAFVSSTDRFRAPQEAPKPPTVPSDAFSAAFSRSKPTAPRGGGMATTNPEMWSAVRRASATMPSGSVRRPNFDLGMFSNNFRSDVNPDVAKEFNLR